MGLNIVTTGGKGGGAVYRLVKSAPQESSLHSSRAVAPLLRLGLHPEVGSGNVTVQDFTVAIGMCC